MREIKLLLETNNVGFLRKRGRSKRVEENLLNAVGVFDQVLSEIHQSFAFSKAQQRQRQRKLSWKWYIKDKGSVFDFDLHLVSSTFSKADNRNQH